MAKDRFLAEDIETITMLIKTGQIWNVVKDHVELYEDENKAPCVDA